MGTKKGRIYGKGAPFKGAVHSSIQYICFRKTSGSKMGAPNLLLAPGAN